MLTERRTLSVFMGNYNHAHYISEALESILSQSFMPTEITIVDDASTDNSIEVIKGFAKRYSNVRLVQNTSNTRGRACAQVISRALIQGEADYVYLAAADDKVLPGFFEKSIGLLERYPQAGLCATYPKFMDAQGNFIKREKLPFFHTHETHIHIKRSTFLSPAEVLSRLRRQPWFIRGFVSVLFRRSVLAEVWGLIPELGVLSDGFALDFVALKYGMCYIPEPLVAFRIMPNSLGANIVLQPRVAMDEFVRIFRLMRETKYRQVFPKSFIDKKRQEFTYTSFRGALVLWQTNFLQELHNLVPPKSLLAKGIMCLLHILMRFQWLMLKVYCYGNIAPIFKEDHPMR